MRHQGRNPITYWLLNAYIGDANLQKDGDLTDKKGEFTFNMIKPGDYYIDIDSASIGLDKISSKKTPIRINVQGGEISTMKLGVTRTAALTGRVTAYRIDRDSTSPENASTDVLNFIMDPSGGRGILAAGGDAKLVEASGLASVVVELRSGSESQCRLTDKQGRFAFEELRPGTWTMVIDEANFPANYTVADKELSYELAPGQTRDVTIKVAPVKRTVQIVEERELSIEKPTSKVVKPKQTTPTAIESPGDRTHDMVRREAERSAPADSDLERAEPQKDHANRISRSRMNFAKPGKDASAVPQWSTKSPAVQLSKDDPTRLIQTKPVKRTEKWLGLASSLILFVVVLAIVSRKLIRSRKNR